MFTYAEYITEAKSKPVVFTFGRFNPLTAGHELMINDVIKQAKSRGGKPLIFTSQTQDTKKNPLSYKDKTKYLKMFWGRKIIKDTKIVTAFNALEWISDKGYKNVIMVVGSDRVARFEKYMRPYVDSYGFEHFEVVQAGVARGAGNEMSASKMRKFAADGDFESYKKGMPSGASEKVTKEIYDAVRAGLGIKEQYLEFGTNSTTKKYKAFTPGQPISDDKIDEASSEGVQDAKKVFTALQTMYPKIPKFPLEFKNLQTSKNFDRRGGGYLQTSKLKGGKFIFVDKMVIDDSGLGSFDPDYAVCHEFAHAILAVTKGNLGHNKKHDDLTHKLAQKFGLV
jgi:nicotinic acid mononucleotide adenylyltransferase